MQDSGCPSSKSKKSYKKDSILFTFNEKWVKNMKKKILFRLQHKNNFPSLKNPFHDEKKKKSSEILVTSIWKKLVTPTRL